MKVNFSLILAGIVILCIPFLPSCFPVFSEIQSAKTVGDNNFQITPTYTATERISDDDEKNPVNHVGVLIDYGITDKVDLRFKYEYLYFHLGQGIYYDYSIFGLGTKIGLIPNKLALSLPIGFESGNIKNVQFQPSLLYTLELIPEKVDFTLAPKGIFYLDNGEREIPNLALNFNLGWTVRKFITLRPEYGFMYQIDGEHWFGQFSFGIGLRI